MTVENEKILEHLADGTIDDPPTSKFWGKGNTYLTFRMIIFGNVILKERIVSYYFALVGEFFKTVQTPL